MDAPISGFEWDESNCEHCRKHGVSSAEIEGLFTQPIILLPDPAPTEERHRAIGRTRHGRPLFIVFTIRERDGQKYIRPVSARYMHKEEIDYYEKENPEF